MHSKAGKAHGSSCLASACESLDPAAVPAVDADVAARVSVEFERFLEMRSAIRKMTGQRRRTLLCDSCN
jgi:hypothetical protein